MNLTLLKTTSIYALRWSWNSFWPVWCNVKRNAIIAKTRLSAKSTWAPFIWSWITEAALQITTQSKPRRRQQQERHKTKGLLSGTITVHMRYNFRYISLPSSAKQEH